MSAVNSSKFNAWQCTKCGLEAAIVVKVNYAFCRNCFVHYATHKFRACIGKSKLIRHEEQILIAFSSGPSSTCLLHLIKEGMSPNAMKRLRFYPIVIYIDETSVVDISDQDRRESLEGVLSILRNNSMPTFVARLECTLAQKHESTGLSGDISNVGRPISEVNISTLLEADNRTERLKLLFSSTQSCSIKEDLLHILRLRLLKVIAKQLGCSKVAVGSSSNRMAVSLMSDLARGRGAHISSNMGFCDSQGDVSILRPLKDFSNKEIAFYNRIHSLESWITSDFTTKSDNMSSIEHLTEDFINNLQVDFESTISNVTRTGEKFCKSPKTSEKCRLCQHVLDGDSMAASALSFTPQLSLSPGGPHRNQESCDYESSLCYGCRIIVTEMGLSKIKDILLPKSSTDDR